MSQSVRGFKFHFNTAAAVLACQPHSLFVQETNTYSVFNWLIVQGDLGFNSLLLFLIHTGTVFETCLLNLVSRGGISVLKIVDKYVYRNFALF